MQKWKLTLEVSYVLPLITAETISGLLKSDSMQFLLYKHCTVKEKCKNNTMLK